MFDFWLKVFALSFGMGVVSGIVMAFQFGTNWSVLAERTGPIQGPLLGYEAFTAFMLEATFFGVMLLGRDRVPPWFYFLSCCMVSLGTMLSSFWILVQQQLDAGAARPRRGRRQDRAGRLVGDHHRADRAGALAAHAVRRLSDHRHERYRHRRLVPAARHDTPRKARVMLRWGLGLVAVLIPVQMFFGHLTGEYVLHYQPAKFAAIEARWQTQQPASEVLIAIPDEAAQRNLFAMEVPKLGSFIASGTWDSREVGLDTFPPEDRPPVLIPFFDLPHHGGHGPDHAGGLLVRRLAALARPAGDHALVPVGRVPVVPHRLRRRARRAGSPPRSAASLGWSTACCAPRTR